MQLGSCEPALAFRGGVNRHQTRDRLFVSAPYVQLIFTPAALSSPETCLSDLQRVIESSQRGRIKRPVEVGGTPQSRIRRRINAHLRGYEAQRPLCIIFQPPVHRCCQVYTKAAWAHMLADMCPGVTIARCKGQKNTQSHLAQQVSSRTTRVSGASIWLLTSTAGGHAEAARLPLASGVTTTRWVPLRRPCAA